jgi:hypothetical protein
MGQLDAIPQPWAWPWGAAAKTSGGDDQGGEELQPVASSTAIRRVGRG